MLKCFRSLSLRHLHLKEAHYLFWFQDLPLKWGLKFGGKQNTFKHQLRLRKITNPTYLNACMARVHEFLFQTVLYVTGLLHITHILSQL